MKVAVLEAADHPGVPFDVAVTGGIPKAIVHGHYAPEMAGRNHGSRSHDRGVHHGAGCAELHSGAARRRDRQHRSSIVYETVGTPGDLVSRLHPSTGQP